MMSLHAIARRLADPGVCAAIAGGDEDGHAPDQRGAAVVPATRVGAPAAPVRLGGGRTSRSDGARASGPPPARTRVVNIQPVVNTVRATLSHQAALAGADPAVASAVAQLV